MTLPYVIKVGGALLESTEATQAFLHNLYQINDIQSVLVHGGGTQVASLLNKLGYTTIKKDGLRVSPPEQMPYVTGMLAGAVNKKLVAQANSVGLKAVGISALDGKTIRAEVFDNALGAVGQPISADSTLVEQLISSEWLPIMACIGASDEGELLNINADHVAATLAESLQCPLLLLSDVPSVLDAQKQRITEITPASLPTLVNDKVITDGMLVKVDAAMATAQKTHEPVIIAGWRDSLSAILAGDAGTHVLPE
ncbi:acetylglutamate kinase [Alteromonas sediminis]|uniref:Acetylglutamate kinase n=1 Tax=Alteromonas sediminis TaxID=2259342 RepID=A0A3N5ZAB5_9ALTE|nr:acetylglutamate kinase [Alteromonas sediminis]RPJ66358.1 acetylglutamate kinase [Alteromonas sediminis]